MLFVQTQSLDHSVTILTEPRGLSRQVCWSQKSCSLVHEAKTWVWEEVRESMEKVFQLKNVPTNCLTAQEGETSPGPGRCHPEQVEQVNTSEY